MCVRIRPLTSDEANNGELPSIVPGPQGSGLLKLLLVESITSTSRMKRASQSSMFQSFSSLSRSWPRTWEFDWVLSGRGSQAAVYNLFGQHLVQNAVEGLHGSVIACGPSSTGKSHTIFGGRPQEQQGLVPRLAEGIFRVLRARGEKHIVKFSYLELYNERIQDLLRPGKAKAPALEVRQHPRVGVFVGNLSWSVVSSVADVLRLLDFGHKMRAVARTNMNAASSRSHAVATFQVEQLVPGRALEDTKRRRAQLQTVDLAGAARMDQIGDSEVRQRESRQINTSLLTLGLVIKRLSSQDHVGHIPCRNSKLTHLLSDSLTGNCRTVMVACVSPASSVVASTESALRFASTCRRVFTHPARNEESKDEMATALRTELDELGRELGAAQTAEGRRELAERFATAQLLVDQYTQSWEEQEASSKALDFERRQLLSSLGLALKGPGAKASAKPKQRPTTHRGVQTPLSRQSAGGMTLEEPCLINVCDDPLLSGCLRYMLPANQTVSIGSSTSCQVRLDGLGIREAMCQVSWQPGCDVEVQVNGDDFATFERQGSLYKGGAPKVSINNRRVKDAATLQPGDVLQVGHGHVFRLYGPATRQNRPLRKSNSKTGLRPKRPAGVPESLVEDLEAELGVERASAVVAFLQELWPLLEEATDLTQELRGKRLVFQAEVLRDGLEESARSSRPDPEVVIALREGVDTSEKGPTGDVDGALLSVWSVEKFHQRLEAMRDLYQEVSQRAQPWNEEDDNPWEDVSVSDSMAHPRIDQGTSTTTASPCTAHAASEEDWQELNSSSITLLCPSQATANQSLGDASACMATVPSDAGTLVDASPSPCQDQGTSMTPILAERAVVTLSSMPPSTTSAAVQATDFVDESEFLHQFHQEPVTETDLLTRDGQAQTEPLLGPRELPKSRDQEPPRLQRTQKGMPDPNKRQSSRWAMKDNGLPTVLKDLAQTVSARRHSKEGNHKDAPKETVGQREGPRKESLHKEGAQSRHQNPARPQGQGPSRVASVDAKDRPLSIFAKRQAGQSPKEEEPAKPKSANPSSREERSPDRQQDRLRQDHASSAPAQRGRQSNSPKTSARRSRSDADTNRDKDLPEVDLFEIPEQLREARRRTSELEAQLAELRQRLQQQEHRALAAAPFFPPRGAVLTPPPAFSARAPGDRTVFCSTTAPVSPLTTDRIAPEVRKFMSLQVPPGDRDHRDREDPAGDKLVSPLVSARSRSPQRQPLMEPWMARSQTPPARPDTQLMYYRQAYFPSRESVPAPPNSVRMVSPTPVTPVLANPPAIVQRYMAASPTRLGVTSPVRVVGEWQRRVQPTTTFWFQQPFVARQTAPPSGQPGPGSLNEPVGPPTTGQAPLAQDSLLGSSDRRSSFRGGC